MAKLILGITVAYVVLTWVMATESYRTVMLAVLTN